MKKRWKFLREIDGQIKSASGNLSWEIGKFVTHKGELDMCQFTY